MRRICASAALGIAFVAATWSPLAAQDESSDALRARGKELFVARCASCHGASGVGTADGPSLSGVGEASADFQLRTGRMPLPNPRAQTLRKPPAFSEDDIRALVEYVGSLGPGPGIPAVETEDASLSLGSRLFGDNCAACHGATANGGAVGGKAFAPSLTPSLPLDVAEAMIVGPGEMPPFGFSPDERNAIVAYVEFLKEEPPPGGIDIGGVGPVSEGFVAWALATVVLLVVVFAIGRANGTGRSA